ncbi:MAG: D-arabinono-1,4-lactone oxidase [bacterium]|nr:FAD-binding protein [Gammaproteobacteria bacterium]HIL97095.1 FAD-binding protein [Pseudomonadales bacterium]
MTGFTRREFLANTALATLMGVAQIGITQPAYTMQNRDSLPWRNWSGGVVGYPKDRFTAATEDQLANFLATTKGPVRPVGSGHSFTPLVPTDGHLIVIDQLSGLIDHDAGDLTATLGAGTRLGDIGQPLEDVGQAMFNLPDIDRQTLAGATATATHGTGIDFKCLSGYVTALRLVTPDGKVMDIDAESDPALFAAARVSVGALGVVTQMTMQNRSPYRLKQKSWAEKTESILEKFDELAASHRHFEMFPLTHSDYCLALSTEETSDPVNNPTPSPEEDAAFDGAMRSWMGLPPEERRPHINGLAEQIGPSERVDTSHRILSNIRNNRFNEMEYAVPIDAGAECLREILQTVADKKIDVVFPLEYRYVSRDDTWLSMSSGHEDHAAISIHRVATEDYRPYFNIIEPIFWKYGGRPHWGKVHSLGADELTKLYPKFGDFQALRQQLDPTGRMLNDHLRILFGVTS